MSTVRVVQWVFGLLAIGALTGAYFMYSHTRSFVDRAVTVPGKVIDNVSKTDSDGDEMYYPSFQFRTLDGRDITAVGKLGASSPDYKPGDAVEVLYEDANPQGAQIRSFSQLWIGPVVIGILGGCCLFVALIMLLVKPKSRLHGKQQPGLR